MISNVSNDSNVSYDSIFSNFIMDSYGIINFYDIVYSNVNLLVFFILNYSGGVWLILDGMNINMMFFIDGVMFENFFGDVGYDYNGCLDFLYNFYFELLVDFLVFLMVDGIVLDFILVMNEFLMIFDFDFDYVLGFLMVSNVVELFDNDSREMVEVL